MEAKAELFAFCSAALPFLHAVDAKAAEALRTEVTLVTDDKVMRHRHVTHCSLLLLALVVLVQLVLVLVLRMVTPPLPPQSRTTIR